MFERELRELSFVPRFTVARTIKQMSVAEHMYYVAVYALEIGDMLGLSARTAGHLAKAALSHDVPEAASGDIPSPFKKAIMGDGEITTQEAKYMATRFRSIAGWQFPKIDTSIIHSVIDVADALEALLFCCTEEQMGNMSLGGGLTGQDLVDVRHIPVPDYVGTRGITQTVLVQLSKAWFSMPMDEHAKLTLWKNHFELAIKKHRWHQSDIFGSMTDKLKEA